MWLYVNSFRLCVCVCVCVCVWVPLWSTRNEMTYSHILTLFITNVNQHSNSVT
jgi:hypothetical protein